MIYLYISPSCQSCRKTIEWFNKEQIEYTLINIMKDKLTKDDIFRMLKNTMNGFEDIISKRSIPFLELNKNMEDMKTSELIDFIIKNPTVLKRPIIVANSIMEVGYNADDIRAFIPPEKRNLDLCLDCKDKDSITCEHLNEATNLLNEIRAEFQKAKTI